MSENSTDIATYDDMGDPVDHKKALYEAFKSGDSRFDGNVFVGVSSTGIYCRPVCKAKMPKYENCTFYRSAAEAEAAGFRPCMTCRPELAPGMALVDAQSNLARRAALVMSAQCANSSSIEAVAARLGYTARHLRRAFELEYGVTPTQYIKTCRLLLAKSLLTDTDLPISQVAKASGFGSVRRFNDVFKKHYRLTPLHLRKKRKSTDISGALTVHVGYRHPYKFSKLLSFYRARALKHVEVIDDTSYSRTVMLKDGAGALVSGWIHVKDDPANSRLVVEMSETLAPVIPEVISRVRRMFDTDSNPEAISAGLAPLKAKVANIDISGIRLPGCFDPFETACRAVLGQQISVKAANKLAERIVDAFGEEVGTQIEGLDRAWPKPSAIASIEDVGEAFGNLGVINSRSNTIQSIARVIESGKLDFGVGAIAQDQMENLLEIKGIGPWSANYIAMRALSYPDAFLETDAGVAHALPDISPAERLGLVEECRPWRSYAVVSLWDSLSD